MRPQEMQIEEVAQVQEEQWGRAGRGGALRSGTFAPHRNRTLECCDAKSQVNGMYTRRCTRLYRWWEHYASHNGA